MAVVPGKNKLKMGSAGRYYSAYLIYDVANSCLAALHAKMPPPVVVTRTNPPSPVHVQNPRKFSSFSVLFSLYYERVALVENVIVDVRFRPAAFSRLLLCRSDYRRKEA